MRMITVTPTNTLIVRGMRLLILERRVGPIEIQQAPLLVLLLYTCWDPRPSYNDGTPAAAGTPTPPYLVDTSGNVYDSDGDAVYVQTGGGTRDPASPWSYTRAKANPNARVADDSALHDYNNEAIGITISQPTGGSGTLKLRSPAYIFGTVTDASGTPDYSGTTSLNEMGDPRLSSSVALVYEDATVGTHTIKIWDATPTNDFPLNALPSTNRPRSHITFMIHVTPSTTTIADDDDINPDIQRVRTDNDVEPVYVAAGQRLTFPTDGNYRIRYEVVRGSGTLYVGTLITQHTTPMAALSVHQDSHVYLNTNNSSNEVHVWFAGEDRSAPRATLIFEYKGQPVPTTRTTPTTTTTTTTTTTQQARLLVSVSGEGTTRSVTVSAINEAGTAVTGIGVVLSSPDFTLSQAAFTGTPVSITVPTTAGSYTIFARHPTNAYAPGTATVTVAGPALGTLTISPSGVPVNGVQNVSITLRTADATIPSETVPVSLSGTGFSPTSVPVTGGFAVTGVVLPVATGTYTLNATATGYDPASIRLTVGTPTTPPGTTPPGTTPTTRGPAGTPSSIRIASEPFPSGTANRQLASPLSARVLDANGNGVASVRVTFQVVSGQGRLSQRGNGRAVRVNTDRNGNASANYTPLADGTSRVRATAAGVAQTVTFTITAGAGAPSTGTTTTRDTGTTTTRTEINPSVQVNAAQRPPMLWVDGGKIYALVGASVQEFGSGVEGAMNIAVGGGKVYWTEKTGESAGTINSANLNGSNVQELASILAVPMGIAVGSDKLYWTNSRGRIQSANLDGSGITNVIPSGLAGCDGSRLSGWQCVLDARRKRPVRQPHRSKTDSQYLDRNGYCW